MTNFVAMNADVIFKFVDNVTETGFGHQTDRIIVKQQDFSTENVGQSRVVDVVAVGPQCEEVKVGDRAIVEALQWTSRFQIDGENVWKTIEEKIVAVIDKDVTE